MFLGEQQTMRKRDMVRVPQPFGQDVGYVDIAGSGPNAADFHIACYIGHASAREPGATFRILWKHTGFDTPVRHRDARGVDCQRPAEIPAVTGAARTTATPGTATPAIRKAARSSAAERIVVTVEPARPPATPPATTERQVQVVLARLAKPTRPGKVVGLRASIRSWLRPTGEEKTVEAIVRSLQLRGSIRIAGTKVSCARA